MSTYLIAIAPAPRRRTIADGGYDFVGARPRRPDEEALPIPITYHVVVAFARSEEGDLVPLEPAEAPNAESARRRAQAAAAKHAGALAFSRTGDPNTGDFEEAKLTASFGEVDMGLLGE